MQLALSSWSFHTPLYAGEMRLWDVTGEARVLGFSQVELQDQFLWPYGNRLMQAVRRFTNPPSPAPEGRFYDPPLLGRVREALAHYGSTLAAWNADPDLGRPQTRDRDRAYVRLALKTARQLGAPLVRITIDHRAAGEHISDTTDSLAVLAVDAEREGVRLALENHGREEMDAAQLLGFVQGVNSPWLGICLDFGNFKPGYGDDDFEMLARHAIHAHAKSYAFDEDGEETTIPFGHRLGVLKSIGYQGVISIEYEGDGDAAEGIRRTHRLIERHW
jgi:sugar phosphate isomerase/epimerase